MSLDFTTPAVPRAPMPERDVERRAGDPSKRLQDLISSGIHHPIGPVRKAVRILLHAPRALRRFGDSSELWALAPPVLANSIPKSGTHLLDQIVAALPQRRNYGTFLESMTASYIFKERTVESTLEFLSRLVSGELVRAHLHHSPAVEDVLSARGIVHYLIYRDPRDVVVSEAHYLRSMNRWHRMHAHFRARATFADAVSLAIEGLEPGSSELHYPDIGRRYGCFTPWLRSPAVHAVRFEELVSPERRRVIEGIARRYARHAGEEVDVAAVANEAEARIAPSRSHTFRSGKSGGWREVFSPGHKEAFKAVTGTLLQELGYEQSNDW